MVQQRPDVHLLLKILCDTHLRAISQEVLMNMC